MFTNNHLFVSQCNPMRLSTFAITILQIRKTRPKEEKWLTRISHLVRGRPRFELGSQA